MLTSKDILIQIYKMYNLLNFIRFSSFNYTEWTNILNILFSFGTIIFIYCNKSNIKHKIDLNYFEKNSQSCFL